MSAGRPGIRRAAVHAEASEELSVSPGMGLPHTMESALIDASSAQLAPPQRAAHPVRVEPWGQASAARHENRMGPRVRLGGGGSS